MKRKLLLVIIILSAQLSSAQNDNSLADVPFSERIFTGGGLGLGFNSYQDYISISPMIGYRFTEKLWGGASITYRYTKYKYYTPAIKLIDYGISPFLRYTIYQSIFIQTEYEYLNYEFPTDINETRRRAYNSFLAGGGFMQPIGDKAAFYALALYNFSYRDPLPGEYSPYYSPWILRAGVSIGF